MEEMLSLGPTILMKKAAIKNMKFWVTKPHEASIGQA